MTVDVIYAAGPARIRAVQKAAKTIPIVRISDDMVSSGLVASLAHPNGNTTGVSILATELNGKRLEILIEAVPGLRRMAALVDLYATSDDRGLEEGARARNVALSIYRVAKGDEIVTAIDTAHASGCPYRKPNPSGSAETNRLMLAGDGRSLQIDLVGGYWPIPVSDIPGSRESGAPAPVERAPP